MAAQSVKSENKSALVVRPAALAGAGAGAATVVARVAVPHIKPGTASADRREFEAWLRKNPSEKNTETTFLIWKERFIGNG